MKQRFLLVNSIATPDNVTVQKIGRHEYYVVSGGGSIVGNTVMNGIYYPLEEVKKLAASNVGRIPAPVSHTVTEDGNFARASDQVAQNDFGIGAFAFNYRMDGDRLVRDIAVPKVSGANKDKWEKVVERINGRKDMDTSTGVIFEPIEEEGVGADGEEYRMIAKNLMLDHDALLPDEVGASTSLMGTGMFANSAGETSKIIEFNASMPAMRLLIAPSETEWDADAADKMIRDFTGSGDEPSSTYRRYFLSFDRSNPKDYASYKMPFATIIDGRPHAVLSAIEEAEKGLADLSDNDKARASRVIEMYKNKAKQAKTNSNESRGAFSKAWNSIKALFAKNELSQDQIYSRISTKLNETGEPCDYSKYPCDIYQNRFIYCDRSEGEEKYFQQGYHIASNDEVEFDGVPEQVRRSIEYTKINEEDSSMDKLKAALNKAGTSTDNMTDDQVLAAYNTMVIANAKAEGGSNPDESNLTDEEKAKKKKDAMTAGNSEDAPEWAKGLLAKVEALETAHNAEKQSELNTLAEKVAGLNRGVSKEVALNMGVDGCKDFIKANSGVVNFNSAASAFGSNSSNTEDSFDLTKLGGDA